ncbi:hypothetical protein IV203_017834 [Nitzschia inconspicua]|uniref:Uncharacterized protein n=1 Tax=Nitzschia inconspicua TaxID=303405 RepID=A0A9K3KFN3_9STRA|nr:hypothetical protein IV203_020535 [Nitzschia inconspicua]KAG7371693.1 hypothetical protein IV203_017834 [Nitzschia inconspicua]
MEDNSLVEDGQQNPWKPSSSTATKTSNNVLIPPLEVCYPRLTNCPISTSAKQNNQYRSYQSHNHDNNTDHDDDDDDEFVCNPPPHVVRAPAVITVPVITASSSSSCQNKRRDEGSKQQRQQKQQRKLRQQQQQRQGQGRSTSKSTQEKNGSFQNDCCDYTMRLLSNIIFLVASCLYVQVAIWKLYRKTTTEDDDVIQQLQQQEQHEEEQTSAMMIIAIASSVGYFLVGCLELYMAETLCTQISVGGMMIVASSLGITSIVLTEHRLQLSIILRAVSFHIYAIVAISIFVLHEDFTDESSTTVSSHPTRTNDDDSNPTVPNDPSVCWRRLADNSFMVGTILDAILSYFYIFDLPSTAVALPMASVGAAACWVMAAILYLVVTLQSRQPFDGTTKKDGRGCCIGCCCCMSCMFPSRKNRDGGKNRGFHPDNVAITVIEGDNTSSTKQDSNVEEGFFSYCGRQIMDQNFDGLCVGGGSGGFSHSNCMRRSFGDGMEDAAAQLKSGADNIMKQVDTVFDRKIFCGS